MAINKGTTTASSRLVVTSGVLQQPLERSVAVRLFFRRAGAVFVERLQEPFEVRAH